MNPFTDLLDLNDKKSYIALLKQVGLSQTEAEDAVHSLAAIYEKYQMAFDDLVRTRYGRPDRYQIIETDLGPRISDSRVMVYDVLDYQNQGKTRGEIALSFNLKMAQVDIAFDYIKQHQAVLESELIAIKARLTKEKAEHRANQKAFEAKIQTATMTKERRAFYELKKANQAKRDQTRGNPAK